ncbi:MAG: hypothetical protein CMJ78_14435 [Planctomycetaceae bacterium]|nr:hypothetical protein [Planctomycetaceae bacterium]
MHLLDKDKLKELSDFSPTEETLPAIIYSGCVLLAASFVAGGFSMDVDYTFTVFVVGLFLLLAIRFSVVTVILITVLVELGYKDQRILFPTGFGLGELIFVAAVVSMVITACRYLVVTSPIVAFDGVNSLMSTCRWILSLGHFEREQSGIPKRRSQSFSNYELVDVVVRVLLAISIASLILRFIPVDPTAEVTTGLTLPGLRTITIALVLLTFIVVVNTGMTLIAWRQNTPVESQVYLRSVITRWCHREIRRIVKRQLRERQKRK